MYFDSLPKIAYPYNKQKKQTILPDIFRRAILDKFFKNRAILEKYYVKDFETPEILAHKLYGRSDYHWILLLANDIIDVQREWPISQEELVTYVNDKYGANNSSSIHHWVLKEDKSVIVDWDAQQELDAKIESVTNLDYETDLNEQKRQIIIPPAEEIEKIVETYKRLVS
tara:strand:- start:54 stop:563 length:510 start_codon:yes stop_codon:yes gene_type:complete